MWNGVIRYSTDTENWTVWDGSEISSIDGRIHLMGTKNTRISATSAYDISPFIITGTYVECVGNIGSLLDFQAVINGRYLTMDNYCFAGMFANSSALVVAPNLPAKTLSEYCYYNMFSGCTSLYSSVAPGNYVGTELLSKYVLELHKSNNNTPRCLQLLCKHLVIMRCLKGAQVLHRLHLLVRMY